MKKLGNDARGNYKLFKAGKTFYLGTNEPEAQIRAIRLGQLWEAIKDRPDPWEGMAFEVGKAIARGETEIPVAPSSLGTFTTMERIAKLQADFPMTRFVSAAHQDMVKEEQKTEAERLRKEADIREHGSAEGLPFHTALDAFLLQSVNLDREPGTDQLSESALRVGRNVKILKLHHANSPLSALDLLGIDKILSYWANRPKVARTGKPASVHTCREQIKIFRRFLRWASRAGLWVQPNGYAVTPVRIRTLPAEHEAKATEEQVQRYKREQLQTIWQYARPLERVYILLALNCGFGQREIVTLRQKDIVGDKIKRVRHKSGVYGEWTLWPETVVALEWYFKHYRPQSSAPEVFMTKAGVPLASRSAKGNHSREIANTWQRVLHRICKDYPDFRSLSFNKLRKTAGNLIRRIAGGEIAKTFLCHGKPVKDDPLSEVYSNRDFRRVFKALRRAYKHLAPVFAAVAEPFPAHKVPQPSLSLGKINRIRSLRAQGFAVAKTAEETGVSKDTVRRYEKG